MDRMLHSFDFKKAGLLLGVGWLLALSQPLMALPQDPSFDLMEVTIREVHEAFAAKRLTCRQLVQGYLDRIEAFDKKGPALNSIISIDPTALEEADRLDTAFRTDGATSSLHCIPIIVKDQFDVKGMPTTLGSVVLEDFLPSKDAFVSQLLRKAGAIILGKATLGELGAGDAYGSLFGATRNPYDLERTAGGSSGGTGAAIAANFATVGVGEEGVASLRRPATWNALVGMRPSAGLISRTGMYDGWPHWNGSLGPMTRTVEDLARLMDVMVGYDPEDPLAAIAFGKKPETYTRFLKKDGLKSARLGIIRESIGSGSEPSSDDYRKVRVVFDRAVAELRSAGAEVIDPVIIPRIKELLALRAFGPDDDELAFQFYFSRHPNAPYRSREDVRRHPEFSKVFPSAQRRMQDPSNRDQAAASHYQYLLARQELMINVLKVMADLQLDALVHNSVEHQPTLISQGINPPYINAKGVPSINTFLVFVPSLTVPAGFTEDRLPVGITFLGRAFDDGLLIQLAYAYEQSTQHRQPPLTTPALGAAR
ncbi:MAG: amidase [Acidobacteria bacterium]|nr:amidase [Acidobacteriota bacterium]